MGPLVYYTFSLRRSHGHEGWMVCSLRKSWWQVRIGLKSRLIAETWFLHQDKPEGALLEDALLEMLRCLANRQE
jgi:hypothetical protein